MSGDDELAEALAAIQSAVTVQVRAKRATDAAHEEWLRLAVVSDRATEAVEQAQARLMAAIQPELPV